MTEHEALRVAVRWIAELQTDLELSDRQTVALEQRCRRLEQAVRRAALARRHWITNGHKERV